MTNDENKDTSTDNCGCTPLPEKGKASSAFSKIASIAGSGIGGFLLGHAGCIITPVLLATVGITAATGGLSVIAFAFGAAASAGGLYLWHRLRGKQASPREKWLVIGSTVSGLALSAALHFGGGHKGHGPEEHKHHHQTEEVYINPNVQVWFDHLATERQESIKRNAELTGIGLERYLSGICLSPAAINKADSLRRAATP
jgi:hypothetical protein